MIDDERPDIALLERRVRAGNRRIADLLLEAEILTQEIGPGVVSGHGIGTDVTEEAARRDIITTCGLRPSAYVSLFADDNGGRACLAVEHPGEPLKRAGDIALAIAKDEEVIGEAHERLLDQRLGLEESTELPVNPTENLLVNAYTVLELAARSYARAFPYFRRMLGTDLRKGYEIRLGGKNGFLGYADRTLDLGMLVIENSEHLSSEEYPLIAAVPKFADEYLTFLEDRRSEPDIAQRFSVNIARVARTSVPPFRPYAPPGGAWICSKSARAYRSCKRMVERAQDAVVAHD